MPYRTSSTLLIDLRDPRNSKAWGVFLDRYRPLLASYALRRGLQQADADDVSQEVLMAFVRALRDGKYERAKGRFRSWLGTIASRKTADALARQGRQGRQVPDVSGTNLLHLQELSRAEGHEQLWEQEWEAFVLTTCTRVAAAEFDSKTLAAFEMVGMEGRHAEEVGQELGISRNAVYIAKSRVLGRMREIREELELEM